MGIAFGGLMGMEIFNTHRIRNALFQIYNVCGGQFLFRAARGLVNATRTNATHMMRDLGSKRGLINLPSFINEKVCTVRGTLIRVECMLGCGGASLMNNYCINLGHHAFMQPFKNFQLYFFILYLTLNELAHKHSLLVL